MRQYRSYSQNIADTRTIGVYNIWLQPYFSNSKQKNIATSPGYRANTAGFLLGGEKEITSTFKLGTAAGYAYTTQESLIVRQTHANINNYIAMFYGINKYEHSVKLDWSISGGQNYYNAFRVVQQTPNTIIANAKYIGAQYTLHGALEKRYNFARMDLIPQINGNLTYAILPEYTESGAGALGNTVPESKTTNLTLGTGVQAEWPSLKEQHDLITEIHALAYYDVNMQMFNFLPSSVVGTPALTTTATTYRATGRIGGSFKFITNEHISIKTEYDLQFKNSYYNNIFFIILKYIF